MDAVIDFETKGTIDLKKVGSFVYANHSGTDVVCLRWKYTGSVHVHLWVPSMGPTVELKNLYRVIEEGSFRVVAHNIKFELDIWAAIMVKRYGAPHLPVEQTSCTMARALAMSLPASLEGCMNALDLGAKKDMHGHRVMLQVAKPRRIEADGTIIWWDDEERLNTTYEYCGDDVEAEFKLHEYLPEFDADEEALYFEDLRINQRGIPINLELVAILREAATLEKKRINVRLKEIDSALTGSKVAVLKEFIERDSGREILDLSAATVEWILKQKDLFTPLSREVALLRQQFAKSSTAKLDAMTRAAAVDGFVHNVFQMNGAGATGRWAGRIIQAQNLPRATPEGFDLNVLIASILNAGPGLLEMISTPDQSVMMLISRLIRSCISALPGYTFFNADFSQIEARVVAWLAGQTDLVQRFARGEDVYCHMAASIFNQPADSFDKKGFERFLGKTTVLGCGFQMGAPKFKATVEGMGIDLSDELALAAVTAFRAANPKIVQFWYAMDAAAKLAVQTHSPQTVCLPGGQPIYIKCNSEWMVITLPSQRKLWYREPRMKDILNPNFGRVVPTLTYMGVDSNTKQWKRLTTYGGKLTENVVQAVARDCLRRVILECAKAGVPLMMHVHDEFMARVATGLSNFKELHEKFVACAKVKDPWAEGLPLASEGWIGPIYKKD